MGISRIEIIQREIRDLGEAHPVLPMDHALRQRVEAIYKEIDELQAELLKEGAKDLRQDYTVELQQCGRLRDILHMRFPLPTPLKHDETLVERTANELADRLPGGDGEGVREMFKGMFAKLKTSLWGFLPPFMGRRRDKAGDTKEILKLTNEIEKLNRDIPRASGKKAIQLEERRASAEKELEGLKASVKTDQADRVRQHVMRGMMKEIGGEGAEIEMESGGKVDTLFLNGASLRNQWLEEGGKKATLSIRLPSGETHEIRGVAFSQSSDPDHALARLERLGALVPATVIDGEVCMDPRSGVGWTLIQVGEKQMLVPFSEIEANPDLVQRSVSTALGGSLCFNAEDETTLVLEEIDSPPQRGVVVMSNNSRGVYEDRAGEALQYLLHGADVMLFNHRGYGRSEGEMAPKSAEEDLTAVHEHLQERGYHPEQIAILSEGLFVGPHANVAAKNPDSPLLVEQTFQGVKKTARELLRREDDPKQGVARYYQEVVIDEGAQMIAPGFAQEAMLQGREAKNATITGGKEGTLGHAEMGRRLHALPGSSYEDASTSPFPGVPKRLPPIEQQEKERLEADLETLRTTEARDWEERHQLNLKREELVDRLTRFEPTMDRKVGEGVVSALRGFGIIT